MDPSLLENIGGVKRFADKTASTVLPQV